MKHHNQKNIPTLLNGTFDIVFQFDTLSLLPIIKKFSPMLDLKKLQAIIRNKFNIILMAIENQDPQKQKIQTALHQLGSELMAIERWLKNALNLALVLDRIQFYLNPKKNYLKKNLMVADGISW